MDVQRQVRMCMEATALRMRRDVGGVSLRTISIYDKNQERRLTTRIDVRKAFVVKNL